MLKGMSWIKTNAKMMMDDSDNVCADLITDGCNMGVKQLSAYINEYESASDKAARLAKRLINAEEKLASELKNYL